MRALTKRDIALIRGGTGTGPGALEAELISAEMNWAEASTNMAYDAQTISELEADEVANPANAPSDEAAAAYYEGNFAENAAAASYWAGVAAEIAEEIG